jgi:hypothetical protein
MVVWGYTRNILLPYIIYRIVMEGHIWLPEPFADCWPANAYAIGFLSVMLTLHYYWYFLFIKMLTHYK